MSLVRCPNCGSVGDPRRSPQCRWCDQTLPSVGGVSPLKPPVLERHAERDRRRFWILLLVVAILSFFGMRLQSGPWLAMLLLPTTGLWLAYLGLHRVTTGSPSRRPIAAFFLVLTLVALSIGGFIVLVFAMCSRMHFA